MNQSLGQVSGRTSSVVSQPLHSDVVDIFLESGFHVSARAYGNFSKPRSGEFVFCTAMSGIEESLTDPSFAGQIVVSTVSHVGNTGFTADDMESDRIWAEGLVCRHLCETPQSWRAQQSLAGWIVDSGRFVLFGVDTRKLTIHLREKGSQRGVIALRGQMNGESAKNYISTQVPNMTGLDLTGLVSVQKSYEFQNQTKYWPMGESRLVPAPTPHLQQVAVWDFGVKRNTLRLLKQLSHKVVVLPATAKAADLLQAGLDGILLSNGPGDPASATHIISELKQLLGRQRIFSICLGHQLVALAAGAKTYKMKFGHRGIHHPVKQLNAQGELVRTWITSQNHGFAVDPDSLPLRARVSFVHADDDSVEGLSLPDYRCETVQFHPEAGPGPFDSAVLFDEFWGKSL